MRLFEDVDADELRDAVLLVLDTWKYNRVPPPALVREALEKLRGRAASDAASAIECRDCNGIGLVRAVSRHYGESIPVMVPCGCALGKSKAIWLNQERRKGFADNKHSYRPPATGEEQLGFGLDDKKDPVPF